jgi:hypothetical protein
MSRTLAISRRSTGRQQLTLLQPEHLASPSACKDLSSDCLTLVAGLLSGSAKSFAKFAHAGSSGKTSPTFCASTEEGRLAPCSGAWSNAGMGSRTEFWTLETSESPKDADVCLLSEVLEAGADQQQHCLTEHGINRLTERLTKYTNESNLLLMSLNSYSDGLGTKRQSTESKSFRRSGHSKAAKVLA